MKPYKLDFYPTYNENFWRGIIDEENESSIKFEICSNIDDVKEMFDLTDEENEKVQKLLSIGFDEFFKIIDIDESTLKEHRQGFYDPTYEVKIFINIRILNNILQMYEKRDN